MPVSERKYPIKKMDPSHRFDALVFLVAIKKAGAPRLIPAFMVAYHHAQDHNPNGTPLFKIQGFFQKKPA
jgi:hypothetical protein